MEREMETVEGRLITIGGPPEEGEEEEEEEGCRRQVNRESNLSKDIKSDRAHISTFFLILLDIICGPHKPRGRAESPCL
jgi:hypothetical protein